MTRRGRASNHIGVYQLATPEHVDPKPEQSGQLPLRLTLQVILQHGLESCEMGEHGEQQRIQIACDVPPVLGAQHFDIRVVWLYYP